MQFGSINLHLWGTRWAAGTGLGLGLARGLEPRGRSSEEASEKISSATTSLAGKGRQNTSGRGASKNSGIKDPEREAQELSFSL